MVLNFFNKIFGIELYEVYSPSRLPLIFFILNESVCYFNIITFKRLQINIINHNFKRIKTQVKTLASLFPKF
ncbi:hypothetical protein Hanom_Chr16g01521921 [Helianthus anomalus]